MKLRSSRNTKIIFPHSTAKNKAILKQCMSRCFRTKAMQILKTAFEKGHKNFLKKCFRNFRKGNDKNRLGPESALHQFLSGFRSNLNIYTYFRPLDQINECTYDPPGVTNGTRPSFMEGATIKTVGVGQSPDGAFSPFEDTQTGASKLFSK